MKTSPLNSLTKKIIALIMISFIFSLLSFGVLCYFGRDLVEEYFILSSYIIDKEKPYIDEFQSYVSAEGISTNDGFEIFSWYTWKHPDINHLTIYRDQAILYDSRYSPSIYSGETLLEEVNELWMYSYSVKFADGPADVFIDANYKRPFYLILYASTVVFSLFLWMLLLILGIRRRVLYIQLLDRQVAHIKQGDLVSDIAIKGNDELGNLAKGLDHMRQALLEKEKAEKILKETQNELVLGMAHDLRTPLSGLVGYLEIARQTNELKECRSYVERSYARSLLLRDLSNQLFDFFLLNAKPSMEMEEPELIEYVLGEYISSLISLLDMEHYETHMQNLQWEEVSIQICSDYMNRIVENLFSNVRRYADAAFPVELALKCDQESVAFILRNHIHQPDTFVKGTGIGIRNVKTMMEQMGGHCEVLRENDLYTITLTFPIVFSL